MLTDRISLELARSYLMGVKGTYACDITNITFRYINSFSDIAKTSSTGVNDLVSLKSKIDEIPSMDISQAECPEPPLSTMGLYELRSFRVEFKDETGNINGDIALLENTGLGWNSKNQGIEELTKIDLNEYQLKYSEVYDLYIHLYDNEYINKQLAYISCNYIQVLFGPVIDKIEKKYKDPQWHLKG